MGFAALGTIWYARAHPRCVRYFEQRFGVDIPHLGDDNNAEGSGPHQTPEDAKEARRQQDIDTARLERVQPISAAPAIAQAAAKADTEKDI